MAVMECHNCCQESEELNVIRNKTQGFRVELQVSGGVGGVTGKGQDRGKTRDKTGG